MLHTRGGNRTQKWLFIILISNSASEMVGTCYTFGRFNGWMVYYIWMFVFYELKIIHNRWNLCHECKTYRLKYDWIFECQRFYSRHSIRFTYQLKCEKLISPSMTFIQSTFLNESNFIKMSPGPRILCVNIFIQQIHFIYVTKMEFSFRNSLKIQSISQ